MHNERSGAPKHHQKDEEVLSPADAVALVRGRNLKRYVRAAAALRGLYDDTAISEAVGVNRGAVGAWWDGAQMKPDTLRRIAATCGGPAPGQVAADNVPPAGSIWFGESFDTTTFALTGRTTTIPYGSQVAFVAHLTRPSKGEVVGLQLDIGGLPATWPGGQLDAGDDVMGQVLPAAEIYQAGPLVVRVVDAGGNTLASGTVTISP